MMRIINSVIIVLLIGSNSCGDTSFQEERIDKIIDSKNSDIHTERVYVSSKQIRDDSVVIYSEPQSHGKNWIQIYRRKYASECLRINSGIEGYYLPNNDNDNDSWIILNDNSYTDLLRVSADMNYFIQLTKFALDNTFHDDFDVVKNTTLYSIPYIANSTDTLYFSGNKYNILFFVRQVQPEKGNVILCVQYPR
jgi:hypothetical protein